MSPSGDDPRRTAHGGTSYDPSAIAAATYDVAQQGSAGDAFGEYRALLFTVAYEMLGSSADAEDVVQESWLRWDGLGAAGQAEVRDPRAYLVRLVTRQALNRLRTLQRRRESYVGPWLPEPVLTTPDVADDVELAESVSLAMLVVLESLSEMERVVFVLREVFGYGYDEIAATVDRTPAAVRQIAHRAREHVAARRPVAQASREEVTRVTERFLAAASGGDTQGLLDLLAPDVVLVTDGGGAVSAARHPVRGADPVARFLTGIASRLGEIGAEIVSLNGAPGVLMTVDGELAVAGSLVVADGRVREVHLVRNPEKLARLDQERPLVRGGAS